MAKSVRSLLPPPGPAQVLSVATLVTTVGNGVYFTISALYFTRSVGLSAQQVGLGLTIHGVVRLLAGLASGHAADRFDPRRLLIALSVLDGIAVAGFAFVHSFSAFLLTACAYGLVDSSSWTVRNTYIARFGSGAERVRTRAYVRAVTNVGFGLGAVLGGVVIHLDTRTAFAAVILGDAATFVISAALFGGLPAVERQLGVGSHQRLAALRDRPYLAFTALNLVLTMHIEVLEVALPLWVAMRTAAPRWVVAVVFVVNCTVVALLSVRTSRGSEVPSHGARQMRAGGFVLAAAWVVYAAASGRSATVAALIVVAGGVVHVAGELLHSAGGFGLGYSLAQEHLQGQYQGVYGLSATVAIMVAPIVLTTLVIGHGWLGWLGLAAVFVAAGAATPPVVRWAERARPGLGDTGAQRGAA